MSLEKNPLAMKSGDIVSKPKEPAVPEVKVVGVKTVSLTTKKYVIQEQNYKSGKWFDYISFRSNMKRSEINRVKKEEELENPKYNFRLVLRTTTDKVIE